VSGNQEALRLQCAFCSIRSVVLSRCLGGFRVPEVMSRANAGRAVPVEVIEWTGTGTWVIKVSDLIEMLPKRSISSEVSWRMVLLYHK
jgi:hypothetical protein